MPLRELVIHRSNIRDLTPLKDMPLTRLDLKDCRRVTDLMPLKGMKLTSLGVQNCGEISDFSALKGMPVNQAQLSRPVAG